MMGQLFVWLQYIVPHRFLSAIVYRLMRWQWGPAKNLIIRMMVRIYRINTKEAARAVPADYIHFNDFFTRSLTQGARPLANAADPSLVLSPSDGKVSAAGSINGDAIFQAKGHEYNLVDLLGGRQDLAAQFQNGEFATVYLAPSDYHRVHMPLTGTLTETVYVPGRLFSVSQVTVAHVPALFARNERLVTIFDTDAGPMAVILVGAMLVSSIETVWSGEIDRPGDIKTVTYENDAVRLQAGEEMGRFNMGSTVVVLFGPDVVKWRRLMPNDRVLMGESIGAMRTSD